jgi:hypothetical protein
MNENDFRVVYVKNTCAVSLYIPMVLEFEILKRCLERCFNQFKLGLKSKLKDTTVILTKNDQFAIGRVMPKFRKISK